MLTRIARRRTLQMYYSFTWLWVGHRRSWHGGQIKSVTIASRETNKTENVHFLHSLRIRSELNNQETRNSAIADKPRDAFKGQSRSPNMVPFHTLGIVSY